MKPYKKYLLATVAIVGWALNIHAQELDDDFLEMSLEDLMNMEITSVSKKAERLQDVASSIYVLTSDDILKSGATTLHEALRLVPGYWGVQDTYSNVEASVRLSQTENTFSGTVLYLLDGTPIQDQMNQAFSFDNFDIPLVDIDRIEVIRGSGGTIYGANSATGVVNIFTKNPGDYDGLQIVAEGASPGYFAGSLSAGGKIGDRLALSGYAKFRAFSGWESMSGRDEDGNPTVARTRFTEDYDKSLMNSFGLKLDYNLSDQTKISVRSHFNTMTKNEYTSYYAADGFDIAALSISDELVLTEATTNRLTYNLRADHSFSEDHNLFFRVSSNMENDFLTAGGGFSVSNAFYDFEIQDNISLGGFNDLSIGANYRMVNFDIHDINDVNTVNFIDPQASESLKGAFVQDKVKLMDGKLNLLLGVKAENYSLVNDDFYFSPMAKLSFIPNENLTVWGGFTQSYTTPGFNNTNIDLFLFSTPEPGVWTATVTQGVYDEAYSVAYQMAIDAGAPESLAESIATTEAENYVSSAEGQGIIGYVSDSLINQYPNYAAKNGTNTVPTKFQTYEAGFRTSIGSKWSVESNFFYTNITDGVAVPDEQQLEIPNEESITQPGRFATYYLYGNYVKGISLGSETMVRFRPSSNLSFELAHSWLESTWEYQENPDFNIHAPGIQIDQTPAVSRVPQHVFKFRSGYETTNNWYINLGLIYATEFATQIDYVYEQERYKHVVFPESSTRVAENSDRLIVNLRIEKKLMEDQISVYAFGNDIFNDGIIANTNVVNNVTLSRIGAMYGLGVNYRLK